MEIKPINLANNRNTEQNDLYVTLICCIILGIQYANFTSGIIRIIIGYLTTILILWKLVKFNYENGYLLLFGTQFLRAVIRVNIGRSSLSFLLFALPIFFFKCLVERNAKIQKAVVLPVLIMAWDFIVSINSSIINVGDQLLWGFSFILLASLLSRNIDIDLDSFIFVFGLAIWGICLVNVFAEIRLFGKTLIPSMYGTWNSLGEYYMFGKGYVDIAGGNEIAQYIPLFIGMTIATRQMQSKKVKLFYLISDIFFAYCGMMCIARAFYVEMIIMGMFLLINISKNPIKMAIALLVLTVTVVFVYEKYSVALQPVIDAVLIRFDSGYGSRAKLLEETKAIWKGSVSTYLFGIGTEYNMVYDTAHNLIYDSAISLGLLGSIMYLGQLVVSVVDSINKRLCSSIVAFMPLCMLAIYKMISGCVKDVPFYFVVAICLFFLREYQDDRVKT